VADEPGSGTGRQDAPVSAVIRIDAVWTAVASSGAVMS
jgi:hypothetical protein